MPENMKRKITVESSAGKSTSNDTLRRPSVFERLGTKASTSSSSTSTVPTITSGSESTGSCRHWALTGSCPYGKNCKYASTHSLISPSKQRAAKKDSDPKQKTPIPNLKPSGNSAKDELNKRLHSAVIKKRTGASPDLNWENWDQTDLEYEDEKVLEKRRQLLQRELELQMNQDKAEQKKKKVKKVKKGVSSSSSTSGSSSSSSESSSSSDESSSSSSSTSADSRRKKMKTKATKRDSSSSTSGADRVKKKSSNKVSKGGSIPPGTKKAPTARKDEQRPQTAKKRDSPAPKNAANQNSNQQPSNKNRSTTTPARNRHRSQSPQHLNDGKNKVSSNFKSKSGVGLNLSPKRSQSVDKKDRRNASSSPRPPGRDRDRERERERERERDKTKEKDREKEKDRDRDKDQGKSRGRDKSQSPGPNGRSKDGASPPRRRPPPRDPRRRESRDPSISKERSRQASPAKSRRSVSRGRSSVTGKHPATSREPDRRESNRNDRRDSRDKNSGAKKTDGKDVKRELAVKGGKVNDSSDIKNSGSRSKDDQDKSRRAVDTASSRNAKKPLPGSAPSKPMPDREFASKSDKDRNSNKDPRGVSRDRKDSRDRDSRDIPDPRLSRNTKSLREMREAAREKEREEALERCRERQRERERKAKEEKAREEKVAREEKLREEKSREAREHERDLPSLLMIATHNPVKSSRTGSDGSKEKGSERGSDRDRDSDKTADRSRGAERSNDRNPNRSADRSDRERGLDRDRDRNDRHSDRDRGFDRASEHDRGLVRGPPDRDRIPERERGFDRDSDRGMNKDPRDRGPSNRGFDRNTERNFERDPGRFDHGHLDRDGHSEYAGLPPRGRDDRRPGLVLEDKGISGYDSPYDPRRGHDDRGRYGDPLDRSHYDDPIMSRDDQRRSGDIRNFGDDRRGHREARTSLEPGWTTRNDRRSPNKSRDYEPRSPIKSSRDYGSRSPNKVRDYDTRSPNKGRDYEPRSPNKSRDYEPRSPPIKGRDYESRSPCHSLKGRDWDYGDGRRDWDGRGGRRGPQVDWDNQHRGDWNDKDGPQPPLEDDWDMYGGQRDWPPAGADRWTEEWDRPSRPLAGPPLRVAPDYVPPAVRDIKPDVSVPDERKETSVDTSAIPDKPAVKLEEMTAKEGGSESLKRPREGTDGDEDKPEPKKICTEESVLPLEEDLSDISDDDADEILNREDIEQASLLQEDQLSLAQSAGGTSMVVASEQVETEQDKVAEKLMIEPSRDSSEQHLLMTADDETVDSLDFEEISDEELEEEARVGLGDALGVDWASLVAEQRPRVRNEPLPGSARRRWDGHRMLARIGISFRYLGQSMADEISAKMAEVAKEDGEEGEETGFLHPVALIHVALREKRERRKELFASAGPYKRALSARRDLLVRRQLCGLPINETTVDSQGPNTEEIFRLAVQLFERGV